MELRFLREHPKPVAMSLAALGMFGLGLYGRGSESNPRNNTLPVNAEPASKATISPFGQLLERRMDDPTPSRKGLRVIRTTDARAADVLLHDSMEAMGTGKSRQRTAIAECAMAFYSIDQLTGDVRKYVDAVLERAMSKYAEGRQEKNIDAGGFAKAAQLCRTATRDLGSWSIPTGPAADNS